MKASLLLICTISPLVYAIPDRTNMHPCPGPPMKGPCNRNIYKWAFDHNREECKMFLWSGCGGNDKNRFDSEKQCWERCVSLNRMFWFL